ncbi:MAG: DUF2256 and DUF3253 domain-containing protein [Myxococcota bacterium]
MSGRRDLLRKQGETKLCSHCGRPFSWRRKWQRVWPQVRYCGARCRREARRGGGERVEQAILALLGARQGTVCPSEPARTLWPDAWRPRMNDVRAAARRLAHEGRVVWRQHGKPVDPTTARGPIRLARGPRFERG